MKKVKLQMRMYKFVKPSFFSGIGSVLNLAGNYYNIAITSPEEDAKAIESDWSVVGYEILDAKSKLEKCA